MFEEAFMYSGISPEAALAGQALFGIRRVGSQVCFNGKMPVPFANSRHLETAFSQPSANSVQEIRLIAEGYMSLSEGILQSKPTADAFFACRFGWFGAGASIY